MNKPEQNPLRHRLRELLAIPERNRTDAEWDELIEIEILLAPGNREGAPMPGQRNPGAGPGNRPKNQNQNQGNAPGRKAAKKFHKRPARGGPR